MVTIYKNAANTVNFFISTNVDTDGFTLSMTLGSVTKTTTVGMNSGTVTFSSADVAALSIGTQTASVEVKDGTDTVQRLHVQTDVEASGSTDKNTVSITIVGECNNQEGSSSITKTSQLTNNGEDGTHPFAAAAGFDTAWVSGHAYAVGDTCVHGGLWYKCATANSDASFTASKWTLVSVKANVGVGATLTDGKLDLSLGIA